MVPANTLLRTAFLLYYRHELFHHKTECLGLRLHVVEDKSSYIPYHELVYRATDGTDDQLEEALANASHIKMKKPGAPTLTIPGDRRNLSPGVANRILKTLGGYRIDDIVSLAS